MDWLELKDFVLEWLVSLGIHFQMSASLVDVVVGGTESWQDAHTESS